MNINLAATRFLLPHAQWLLKIFTYPYYHITHLFHEIHDFNLDSRILTQCRKCYEDTQVEIILNLEKYLQKIGWSCFWDPRDQRSDCWESERRAELGYWTGRGMRDEACYEQCNCNNQIGQQKWGPSSFFWLPTTVTFERKLIFTVLKYYEANDFI